MTSFSCQGGLTLIGGDYRGPDFNNDGLTDTARITEKGEKYILSICLGGCQDPEAEPDFELEVSAVSSGSSLKIKSTADFNGDGLADILIQEKQLEGEHIRLNSFKLFTNISTAPSKDQNRNFIPDECELATPGDFDGDKRTDFTVARESLGGVYWFSKSFGEELFGAQGRQFGLAGYDIPYAGDFDGDGKFEPAVVRNWGGGLYWLSEEANGGAQQVQWGLAGDSLLTGYIDDDRKLDRIVVREQLGSPFYYWFINSSGGAHFTSLLWGLNTDTPFTGDLNGDGKDELIVAREVNGAIVWFGTRSPEEATVEPRVLAWGLAGDKLLPPADFDQDGIDDLVVVRSDGVLSTAFIRLSATNDAKVVPLALSSDIPAIGSFAGSNESQIMVYRAVQGKVSSHFVLRSDDLLQKMSYGLWFDYFIRPGGLGIN